jgi:protein O-GlcNAc transferase
VRTIQSLRKSLGNDGAHLICDTVVIDDNSSNEDRAKMLDKFPEFTFVFKSHSQRGHAKSMNILMSLVKTRYVFYLEDDWEFSSSVASNGRFIRDALAVLQHGVNEHERIIQVLLNNQHGGWQRHLTYTESSAPTASAATSEVTYFFHEYASTHPLHTFSYWPGFSLNPGIWDLKTIRQMDSHFNEMNSLFEREFSLHMWKLGLHVAYLPYVTSIHIGAPPGTNQSAYVLNALPRSFDLPQP